jgi:hypothetical protein
VVRRPWWFLSADDPRSNAWRSFAHKGTIPRLRRLEAIAGPDAIRRRGWPATPQGLRGILRRLAPSLAVGGIVIGFDDASSAMRIIRIHQRPDLDTGGGAEISTLSQPGPVDEVPARRVAERLRAAAVDATWRPTEAATEALRQASGTPRVAASALNLLGVSPPGGGPWTPDVLRGVI